jgi:C_GCAxxG_C_C family probable redox protein
MLYELLKSGYGQDQDFNCAEKILYGANEAYQLGLSHDALKMAAGFGGGMAIEDVCGALTASIMVLGRLFVKGNAHESTRIKDLTTELFKSYRKEMSEIDCAPLKAKYRTEEFKCRDVILKAAQVLDGIVQRELELDRCNSKSEW